MDKSEWIAQAIKLYNMNYRMDGSEFNEKAYETLQELYKIMPEELKNKNIVIGKEMADLGEDIVLYNNRVTHTSHVPCKKCGNYSRVNNYCYFCAE